MSIRVKMTMEVFDHENPQHDENGDLKPNSNTTQDWDGLSYRGLTRVQGKVIGGVLELGQEDLAAMEAGSEPKTDAKVKTKK